MKPNLFEIATSELSQDGFITWLLKWGDPECKEDDPILHETAKDFIKLLIGKNGFEIKEVKAGRQWDKIDIWAEIKGGNNNCISIIIEDKTYTGEHDDQLERYLKTATDYYSDKSFKVYPIYLKTGNESERNLKYIEDKGYKVIRREDILKIFEKTQKEINNAIFNDFYEHILRIETETKKHEAILNNWNAAQGFYIELEKKIEEKKIDDWRNWSYESNARGGFLCFYGAYVENSSNELYIQIENYVKEEKDIKLTIRIKENVKLDTLYAAFDRLKTIATKHELQLEKPDKYREGRTSAVAIVKIDDLISCNYDIDKFVDKYKVLYECLKEYKEKHGET